MNAGAARRRQPRRTALALVIALAAATAAHRPTGPAPRPHARRSGPPITAGRARTTALGSAQGADAGRRGTRFCWRLHIDRVGARELACVIGGGKSKAIDLTRGSSSCFEAQVCLCGIALRRLTRSMMGCQMMLVS